MLRFLCNSVEGLRVEQKWLLIQLMHTYVKRGAIRASASELAKTHSVSIYVVRAVINGFLVKRGILTPERGDLDNFAGQQKRGRPQVHYKLESERLEEELKAGCVEGANDKYERVINKLLLEGFDLGLSKAQQLLLAVLLAYADDLGIVKQLGQASLRGLVGVGGAQLTAQINQLVDKGFILRVLPGGVSAKVFGLQRSLYVLNVKVIAEKLGASHGGVQVSKHSVSRITQKWFQGIYGQVSRICDSEKMLNNEERAEEQKRDPRSQLTLKRRRLEDRWLNLFDGYFPFGAHVGSEASEVRDLFRGLFSGGMRRSSKLFSRKLAGYAALYLSERSSKNERWEDSVREVIKGDILPEEGVERTATNADGWAFSMYVTLVEVIWWWTKIIALEYEGNCKELQEFSNKTSKSGIAVAIVPGEEGMELDWILVSDLPKV